VKKWLVLTEQDANAGKDAHGGNDIANVSPEIHQVSVRPRVATFGQLFNLCERLDWKKQIEGASKDV
jgi:hypothetical protein